MFFFYLPEKIYFRFKMMNTDSNSIKDKIFPSYTELRVYPSFTEIREKFNAPQVLFQIIFK